MSFQPTRRGILNAASATLLSGLSDGRASDIRAGRIRLADSSANSAPTGPLSASFRVEFPQAQLDTLRNRLLQTRWPDELTGDGWSFGTDVVFMKELTAYWVDGFDWRMQERKINRFAQYRTQIDDQALHFMYEKGSRPKSRPLLLMHGWPYSFASFVDIIEPLAHPERFGGDPADAFDVITPSLPGFAFSDKPPSPMGCRAMGHKLNKLMVDVLGYDRYVAAGGDWGGHTAEWLGFDHPENVEGVHSTIISVRPVGATRGSGGTGGVDTDAVVKFMQSEK